jgi:small-conductance mechanosensitive channel
MDDILNMEKISNLWASVYNWLDVWVLSYGTLTQFVLIGVFYAIANIIAKKVDRKLDKVAESQTIVEHFDRLVEPLYAPIIFLIMIWLAIASGHYLDMPVYLFDIASSLVLAWVVIRLAASLVGKNATARFVAVAAWSIAALDIIQLLDPLIAILEGAAVDIGTTRLSLFDVIWGVSSIFIFIWLALFVARLIDVRLKKIDAITPSAQVLITKVVKIVFVSLAFLIALNSTGIDLTALAVFGGALGVGLGFGLQKVVSNFISGMILLLDHSIKPGDVVQIQDTYGSINALNARYTSVITRDGTEYLIPNEDMITQQVINWSHTNSNIRRRIPVCVAYDSDVEKVMDILVKAAQKNNRVLKNPEPQSRLIGFGENGINLELRMWINDPQNGVRNIASEVLLEILKEFRSEGISLPFPQRVVHLVNSPDGGKS